MGTPHPHVVLSCPRPVQRKTRMWSPLLCFVLFYGPCSAFLSSCLFSSSIPFLVWEPHPERLDCMLPILLSPTVPSSCLSLKTLPGETDLSVVSLTHLGHLLCAREVCMLAYLILTTFPYCGATQHFRRMRNKRSPNLGVKGTRQDQ